LVGLRDRYAAAADDRRAVLSMADAVRYAEAIMTAIELDAEPWHADRDEASAAESRGARPAARPAVEPPATWSAASFAEETEDRMDWPRFASDLWPWASPMSRGVDDPDEPDRD
jgi:hypothetical protein